MSKKNIGIIVAAVLLVAIGLVFWEIRHRSSKTQTSDQSSGGNGDSEIVLYFGQECAPCMSVKQFVEENHISNRISLAMKEVWHSGANLSEMNERAMQCNLDVSKTGVPLIWARGKCYVGEAEVQKFLKQEAGQ